jgi:murein DD-endopeptidase MepM/ murein hydrolase activator NlpD
MKKWWFLTPAIVLLLTAVLARPAAAQEEAPAPPAHVAAAGETWTALALGGGAQVEALLRLNRTINRGREPAIGGTVLLPAAGAQRNGRLLRPTAGGLLALGAANGRSPWALALANGRAHPYAPLLTAPLLLDGGTARPLELPPGFSSLALDELPAQPGRALTLRGAAAETESLAIDLAGLPWTAVQEGGQVLALGATGAFFAPGRPLLRVSTGPGLVWEQPLLFVPGAWTFEQVTFSGTAVFDAEELRIERERLQRIWGRGLERPLWDAPFRLPLDEYVEITSYYGARRSVNGGPYSSYHEGTDFSAYGGTPVYAPAAGRVVLAEELNVRGGAVILDHGLGLHSGYYHLSAIHVRPWQTVAPGDLLGEVGTTGRSTGNHLHWDLLVGTTWVDGLAWLESQAAEQPDSLPADPLPAD